MTADMSAETIGSRSLFFLLSSELLQDLRTSLSCSVMLGHYVITVDDNDTDARLRRSQVEIDFFFFSFAFRVVGACKWGVSTILVRPDCTNGPHGLLQCIKQSFDEFTR